LTTPSELADWAQAATAEAAALRSRVSAAFPAHGAPVPAYIEALHFTRAVQDRVEELLGLSGQVCSWARRWHVSAADAEADAYDQAVAALRRTGRHAGEYSSARERQADVGPRIATERQRTRAAKALLDDLEAARERIRTAHAGINGTRQDLGTLLRSVQWESSIDR
jgi:hypothetical protein